MSTIRRFLNETSEDVTLQVCSIDCPDSVTLSDGTEETCAKFMCDIGEICTGDTLRISSYVCNVRDGKTVPFVYAYTKGNKKFKCEAQPSLAEALSLSSAPETKHSYDPISGVRPENKYTICGKITHKSDVKKFGNGNGCLFSFDVVDDSGKIRATAFNDGCNMFFDYIEVGNCYEISGARAKASDERYNDTGHPFELTIGKSANIKRSDVEIAETFDFVKDVSADGGRKYSLQCTVYASEGINEFTDSSGASKQRQTLRVYDSEHRGIRMTVFGQLPLMYPGYTLIVRGAKAKEWNGLVSITADASGVVIESSQQEDQRDVEICWNRQEAQLIEISNIENLPDDTVFALKGKIVDVSDKFTYNSGSDHKWRLNLTLVDEETDSKVYVTCFDDQAKVITGTSANEFMGTDSLMISKKEKLCEVIQGRSLELTCRVNFQMYNDKTVVKVTCMAVTAC